jgi:SchA/CurD like domain
MNRYALSFAIRPGSEDDVARILSSYGRPQSGPGKGPGGPPLLNRTTVFMAGPRVLRVMDVNSDLTTALRFLAAQPPIRAVEESLNAYLVEPRDLDDPAGLRAFIARSALRPALFRVTDPSLLPDVPDSERGRRHALLYPARPGRGADVAALLADAPALPVQAQARTTLAHTAVYRRRDIVVRLIEVDGSVDEALDHLATVASRAPSAAKLAEMLDTDADLTTRSGFREFLDRASMTMLTDRRVGVPA